jgi:hypothetical protein
MTDKLVTAVQAYLHPLERVKIAIEAGLPDKKLKRYLAVVTNETGKSKEAAYVHACVIVACIVVRARKDFSVDACRHPQIRPKLLLLQHIRV